MKRIFLSAALALLAAGANADPILIIDPVPTDPALGSQVVVNVSVDPGNVVDPSFIGDYLLFLFFDDTILSFNDIVFGTQLDGPDPLDSEQSVFDLSDGFGNGLLDIAEISLVAFFGTQDGVAPFSIFDVTFDVIGTGPTSLFVEGELGDEFGFPFAVFEVASIEAVQVPEPGTLALFGIGLLGIGLTRRRRSICTEPPTIRT